MANILIIDDSPSALENMEAILVAAGHCVLPFLSSLDALKQLDQTHSAARLDLVITDIYMPDRDGLEIIREVRRLHVEIPIIAVSGVAGPKNMLGIAKCMGAARSLMKPFTEEQLLESVAAALSSPADPPPGRP